MDYINSLMIVFQKGLQRFPDLQVDESNEILRQSIIAKKYDLQDEAIIEAILQDKERSFEKSFYDGFEYHLNGLDSNIKKIEYLNTQDGITEIIRLFLIHLDQTINYYYNSLLNKHFS